MDFDVSRQRVLTHVKGLIISTLQFLQKKSLNCLLIKLSKYQKRTLQSEANDWVFVNREIEKLKTIFEI